MSDLQKTPTQESSTPRASDAVHQGELHGNDKNHEISNNTDATTGSADAVNNLAANAVFKPADKLTPFAYSDSNNLPLWFTIKRGGFAHADKAFSIHMWNKPRTEPPSKLELAIMFDGSLQEVDELIRMVDSHIVDKDFHKIDLPENWEREFGAELVYYMTMVPFVKESSEPVSAAMHFSMTRTLTTTIPARHKWLREAHERGSIDAEGEILYPPAPSEYSNLGVFEEMPGLLPDFQNGSFRQGGAAMTDHEALMTFVVVRRS